jgi:DNA-binding PadR family transcriptional regulator
VQGWVTAEGRTTGNDRRARYYALTPVGKKQVAAERAGWERSISAVD